MRQKPVKEQPKGPFLLQQATKGCLDGECKGEVVSRCGIFTEVKCWRVIYTPTKYFYFESPEEAYSWAKERGLELRTE